MSAFTEVEFHDWRFLVDIEATRAAYAKSDSRGARDCGCGGCRNFVELGFDTTLPWILDEPKD